MTTLVALATKDALLLGCDSLGTTTEKLIDPKDILEFFDFTKGEIKKDKEGNPIIKKFWDIYRKAKPVPSMHMTHMTKLFSLSPLEMGIMSAGIVSIGDRTIKTLIEEFKKKKLTSGKKYKPKNYTVKVTADKFLEFVSGYYKKQYPDEKRRPYLEFILGGYDKRSPIPKIMRIKLPEENIEDCLEEAKFGIVFGGQMKEIQRIVFGTDYKNLVNISVRHRQLLKKYRDRINRFLKEKKVAMEIPELTGEEMKKIDMFSNKWELEGLHATWGDFSEQNAIECVDFFVDIMIKSQQFSSEMPTVGGEVHIALITKAEGFQFVSREEYFHAGHFTPKEIEKR